MKQHWLKELFTFTMFIMASLTLSASSAFALFSADRQIARVGEWTLWTGLYNQGCIVDYIYHSRNEAGTTFTWSVRIGGESNGSYFLQVDLDSKMFGFDSNSIEFFDSIQLPELMFLGGSHTASVDSARGSASLYLEMDEAEASQLSGLKSLFYADRGSEKLKIAVPSPKKAMLRLKQCIADRQ